MNKKVSAKSLANLKPQKKGEPAHNPNGRKGADGTGGLSLKNKFRKYMQSLSPEAHDAIWFGLIAQAQNGNTAAIKMIIELGGEQVNDQLIEMDSDKPNITIKIIDSKENNGGTADN